MAYGIEFEVDPNALPLPPSLPAAGNLISIKGSVRDTVGEAMKEN